MGDGRISNKGAYLGLVDTSSSSYCGVKCYKGDDGVSGSCRKRGSYDG